MDKIFVTRGTDAPVFSVEGFGFIGQTAPSRGSSELATWRVEAQPGSVSGYHSLDREETFLVIAGTVALETQHSVETLSAGDAAAVPANTVFRLINSGDETAHFIACLPVGATAVMSDGTVIGTPPWAR